MKKVIFLLIAIMILISCTACAKDESNNSETQADTQTEKIRDDSNDTEHQTENQTEKIHTVNIYISKIYSNGEVVALKQKTMEVKDGDVIGKISNRDFKKGEFKGFFTTKTAVQEQEWNPLKDAVHSDLDIYAVWEYTK